MKNVLFTALMLFLISPVLNATLIVWSGGTGSWDDASMWAGGAVPGIGDDVYIDDGTVTIAAGFIAEVQSVTVHFDGELAISSGGYLKVDGSNATSALWTGVYVRGQLNVYGSLLIRNTPSGPALGIQEYSVVNIGESGIVNIIDAGSDGINNGGEVVNEGYIFIKNVGNHGIINHHIFTNTDRISILNAYAIGFTCWTGGTFHNSGELNVKGAEMGIGANSGDALIVNEEQGEIYLSYVDIAVHLSSGNDIVFINYGQIDATWQIGDYGLRIWNEFNNEESGTIELDYSDVGISVVSNGVLSNSGNIIINDHTQDFAIKNEGQLYNLPCGRITVYDAIAIENNNDDLHNEGEIYNYSTSTTSYNDGDFINDGLIEDNPGTLLPIVANEEVIVKALNGNVQEGVPVSNVLNLNNVDYYIFRGCYTSPSATTSAGWYNAGQNEWTPNTAAVGLTEVYLQVGYRVNVSTLCTSTVKIEIPGGVQQFSGPSPFGAGTSDLAEANNTNFMYPNPFRQSLNLRLSADLTGEHTLSLYDVTGRLVLQQSMPAEQRTIALENLSGLASGTYLLTLSKEGELVWQDRVVKL